MWTRRMILGLFVAAGVPATRAARAQQSQPKEIVRLMEVPVAGYRDRTGPRIEGLLATGVALRLVREPDDPHDALAVAILSATGAKIGYVPFHMNTIPARLLDGGFDVRARVASVATGESPWRRVRVEIGVVR